MTLLGGSHFLDATRWESLARAKQEAWLETRGRETPTQRFLAPERWRLGPPSPRTPEEEAEDLVTHSRVAAVLARARTV